MRKPKMKLHSLLLLSEIDRYIRAYDVHGYNLISAASDVLDSAVFRHEIDDLLRRRLVCIIKDGCGDGVDPGDGYTLHLTSRAVTAFWAARSQT